MLSHRRTTSLDDKVCTREGFKTSLSSNDRSAKIRLCSVEPKDIAVKL